MAIFPGEPGLAGCPLILLLHLFLDCASFWDRPNTIPPGLFLASSLSNSFNFPRYTTFDPVITISITRTTHTQKVTTLTFIMVNNISFRFTSLLHMTTSMQKHASNSIALVLSSFNEWYWIVISVWQTSQLCLSTEWKRYKEIFATLKMKNKNIIKTFFAGVQLRCRRLVNVQLKLYTGLVVCTRTSHQWDSVKDLLVS